MLRYRQHKFEANQEFFECFKSAASVIIQYYGSIGQDKGLLKNTKSKEDMQEKLLIDRIVHNYNGVRYDEIHQYMHNRYVNSEDRYPRTLSAILNFLMNWKGGNRSLTQK